MRCSLHTLLSITLLALTACSANLKKVGTGGTCSTNSDCSGNSICRENRCEQRLDCNLDANIYAAQCPGRGCTTDARCPNGYCDAASKKCVPGDRPACAADADCATSLDGAFCLTSTTAEARCVECLNTDDCPPTGGKVFDCKNSSCVPRATTGTCKVDKDCTASSPKCNPATKACVQCTLNTDCKDPTKPKCNTETFLCEANVVTAECTQVGCGTTKICDAGATSCRDCASNTECQALGANLTCQSGSCLPQVVNNECVADSDCTAVLPATVPATSMPAGYNAICDTTVSPRVCRACLNDTECQTPGTVCAVHVGSNSASKVCGPTSANTCNNASQCPNDTDACVNGSCSATCSNTNQCRDGFACNNAGQCVANATCPTVPCSGGLVCVNSSCVNCTNSNQCSGDDVCQNGLCVTPQPAAGRTLGSVCVADTDCDSGLCREFDNATGGAPAKFRVCTKACQQTKSVGTAAADCPNAPPAGISRTGLANLTGSKGFLCAPFIRKTINGQVADGLSLCLHADDFDLVRGTGTSPASAFTVPAGTGILGSGTGADLVCQSGMVVSPDFVGGTPQSGDVCAAGCGSRSDCVDQGQPEDFTCAAELAVTSRGGQFYAVPSGRNACQLAEGNLEGRFCRDTANSPTSIISCQSSFCAGSCIKTGTPTTNNCGAGNSCPAGQFCNTADNKCVASTEFVFASPASCTTDNQCGAGKACRLGKCTVATCDLTADCTTAGATGAFCMNSKCYTTSATVPSSRCQSDFECGANQECGGRCALFCNDRSDCTSTDSQLRDKVNVVCGYWESQPASGQARQRICRGRLPQGTHAGIRGSACTTDVDCVTEVCDGGKCTDFCGRADRCLANETCKLRPHAVQPGGESILSPICVPN